MIFTGLILAESRLEEMPFPNLLLASLRPGFRDGEGENVQAVWEC